MPRTARDDIVRVSIPRRPHPLDNIVLSWFMTGFVGQRKPVFANELPELTLLIFCQLRRRAIVYANDFVALVEADALVADRFPRLMRDKYVAEANDADRSSGYNGDGRVPLKLDQVLGIFELRRRPLILDRNTPAR